MVIKDQEEFKASFSEEEEVHKSHSAKKQRRSSQKLLDYLINSSDQRKRKHQRNQKPIEGKELSKRTSSDSGFEEESESEQQNQVYHRGGSNQHHMHENQLKVQQLRVNTKQVNGGQAYGGGVAGSGQGNTIMKHVRDQHGSSPTLLNVNRECVGHDSLYNQSNGMMISGSATVAGASPQRLNKDLEDDVDDDQDYVKRAMLSVPQAIPIITSQYSLKPDMMFGWKPQISLAGAPIPLYFDYEQYDLPINPSTQQEYEVLYYGPRFKDSLDVHKCYANIVRSDFQSYKFKFPPNMNVIEAMQGGQRRKKHEYREFLGMNPEIQLRNGFIAPQQFTKYPSLIFDSNFESGNLDTVIQVRDLEYDLYMRVDSNTRGHHQWFYFTVENPFQTPNVKVRFNIVNFTKNASLYHQGMKINIFSKKDYQIKLDRLKISNPSAYQTCYGIHHSIRVPDGIPNEGWVKGGENIQYKISKMSQIPLGAARSNPVVMQQYLRSKKYFQLSFDYEFQHGNDKVSFAYSVPYSFSKLYYFLKQLPMIHQQIMDKQASNQANLNTFNLIKNQQQNQAKNDYTTLFQSFVKETSLCKSLSGLDVPMLTITSRINQSNFEEIDPEEFPKDPLTGEPQLPLNKYKKHVIVCSRVHPGESNSSFIMHGFIKFLTSPTIPEAIELRKRLIFKVIPVTNPDGVIVGNYRTGMCGSDLNRQFINPNEKLHPTVCAIKQLINDIIRSSKEPEPISSFIDIHGHSRKKSIFIYGPYFPLHNERYLKMRVLPKLLSEKSEMFRFYSCKFRIQKSKLKAARVVLWKEYGIMNCFTLEASFHGYIDRDRVTVELTTEMLEQMGKTLGEGFHEYHLLVEEDEKQRLLVKQQIKNKKKKLKAKDLVNACNNNKSEVNRTELKSPKKASNLDVAQSTVVNEVKKLQLALSEVDSPKKVKDGMMSPTSKSFRKKSLSKVNNDGKVKNLENPSTKGSFKDVNLLKPVLVEELDQLNTDTGLRKVNEEDPLDEEDETTSRQSVSPSRVSKTQIKKPFRIKKQKMTNQKSSLNLAKNDLNTVSSQKRTLKEIYKLLKRDLKVMALPLQQADYPQNQNANNGNQYDGFSSNSDDEYLDDDGERVAHDDDEDELDDEFRGGGCDCEKSMIQDDLSPSELEELQGDIIKAIENFDDMFNCSKKKKQTASSVGKQSQLTKKKAAVGLNALENQVKEIPENAIQIKNTKPENAKSEIQKKQDVIKSQKPAGNIIQGHGYGSTSGAKNISQSEKTYNRRDDQATQYSKFILQTNASIISKKPGSSYIGTLYGEKIQSAHQSNFHNSVVGTSAANSMFTHSLANFNNLATKQQQAVTNYLQNKHRESNNSHIYLNTASNQPDQRNQTYSRRQIDNQRFVMMPKNSVNQSEPQDIFLPLTNSSVYHQEKNGRKMMRNKHISHGPIGNANKQRNSIAPTQGQQNSAGQILPESKSQNERCRSGDTDENSSITNHSNLNDLNIESVAVSKLAKSFYDKNQSVNRAQKQKRVSQYEKKQTLQYINNQRMNLTQYQNQEFPQSHQIPQNHQHQEDPLNMSNTSRAQSSKNASKQAIPQFNMSNKSSRMIFSEGNEKVALKKMRQQRTPNNGRGGMVSNNAEPIITFHNDIENLNQRPYSLNQKGNIIRQQLVTRSFKDSETLSNQDPNSKDYNAYDDSEKSPQIMSEHVAFANGNQSLIIQNIIINQTNNNTIKINSGGIIQGFSRENQFKRHSQQNDQERLRNNGNIVGGEDESSTPNSMVHQESQHPASFEQVHRTQSKARKKKNRIKNNDSKRGQSQKQDEIPLLDIVTSQQQQQQQQRQNHTTYQTSSLHNLEHLRKHFKGIKAAANVKDQHIKNPYITQGQILSNNTAHGFKNINIFQGERQSQQDNATNGEAFSHHKNSQANSHVNHSSNTSMPTPTDTQNVLQSIQATSKIAQMATQHIKKHSQEYDNMIKQHEKDVMGSNYIYNLKPLKEMIVSNINQMKYTRAHIPQDQIYKKPTSNHKIAGDEKQLMKKKNR